MKGEVLYRNNMVPFKMIGIGECFIINQRPCMKVALLNGLSASNKFVYLDSGNVDSVDLDTKVVPMSGSYTMVETDFEEEDDCVI